MPPARHRSAAAGHACARLAAFALVATAAADASADGEQTPMLGGAVVAASGPEQYGDLLGAKLEAAWWWGRIGLAPEGAMLWDVAGDGTRAATLGASARIRVLEQMLPSLLEPRDVELGIELHAIVERTWWDGDRRGESPTGYGLGIAVRLRGGSDDFSSILTESRLFVRAVSGQPAEAGAAARAMELTGERARELTILVGLGAAFGLGEPRYLDRFRLRPLEVPLGPPAGGLRPGER